MKARPFDSNTIVVMMVQFSTHPHFSTYPRISTHPHFSTFHTIFFEFYMELLGHETVVLASFMIIKETQKLFSTRNM